MNDGNENTKRIPWWRVDYGLEVLDALIACNNEKAFSMGNKVQEFEASFKNLFNFKDVVAVTSGSDAILLSLITQGVQPGDKVLIQDRSWIAAANAAKILGAQIILVDIDKEEMTLSLEDLEKKYEKDVKGLIVVHMNGRSPDMLKVREFCDSKGIFLIEDSAQALGSRYAGKLLGSFGSLGIFSLSTAKIIGAGQGGVIVVNDSSMLSRIRKGRIHGVENVIAAKWEDLGFNFRMTDLHAAIALTQLPKYQQRMERLKEIQQLYINLLKDFKFGNIIEVDFASGQVGPYVEFLLDQAEYRQELMDYLDRSNVEVRPFYPSISESPILGDSSQNPFAQDIARRGLYLPSGPGILDEEILFATAKIKMFFQNRS